MSSDISAAISEQNKPSCSKIVVRKITLFNRVIKFDRTRSPCTSKTFLWWHILRSFSCFQRPVRFRKGQKNNPVLSRGIYFRVFSYPLKITALLCNNIRHERANLSLKKAWKGKWIVKSTETVALYSPACLIFQFASQYSDETAHHPAQLEALLLESIVVFLRFNKTLTASKEPFSYQSTHWDFYSLITPPT